MRHLHEYQQRVVDEKSALDEKIVKLSNFAGTQQFQTVPRSEQNRLLAQLGVMSLYSRILGERISAFLGNDS